MRCFRSFPGHGTSVAESALLRLHRPLNLGDLAHSEASVQVCVSFLNMSVQLKRYDFVPFLCCNINLKFKFRFVIFKGSYSSLAFLSSPFWWKSDHHRPRVLEVWLPRLLPPAFVSRQREQAVLLPATFPAPALVVQSF